MLGLFLVRVVPLLPVVFVALGYHHECFKKAYHDGLITLIDSKIL